MTNVSAPRENQNNVFLVSGGRTGTTFFGEQLSHVIDDSFSVHEPDLLSTSPRRFLRSIKDFGFYHMTVGRVLGQTGVRNLAQKYLSGVLSEGEVAQQIRRHREKYYGTRKASLLIESYYQWFGLLPPLRQVFPRSKIVGIIRDPRDWVGSWISYGSHHDDTDMVARLKQSRLSPSMMDHNTDIDWSAMNQFEKLCWDWNTTNTLICDFSAIDEQTRFYRFEDMFDQRGGKKTVDDFLKFITRFDDRSYSYDIEKFDIETRQNASTKTVPNWVEWSSSKARTMDRFCGPLMRKLGYGEEPEWIQKLG